MAEEQAGFRTKRGTTEQNFTTFLESHVKVPAISAQTVTCLSILILAAEILPICDLPMPLLLYLSSSKLKLKVSTKPAQGIR